MDKKNLEKARNNIIANLDKIEMDIVDKVEIMTNVDNFLGDYDNNIKKLNKTDDN